MKFDVGKWKAENEGNKLMPARRSGRLFPEGGEASVVLITNKGSKPFCAIHMVKTRNFAEFALPAMLLVVLNLYVRYVKFSFRRKPM